jgi:hypothetical protein
MRPESETLSSLARLYLGSYTKRHKATSMPKLGQNIPLLVLSVLPIHHNSRAQTVQDRIRRLPIQSRVVVLDNSIGKE